MTSTYEGKKSIESNGLYKLLSHTDIQVIGDSLFIKLITQKEKEMEMRIKERREFSINR